MERIEKGKQQILFSYLPGKVFDFKKSIFATIQSVKGSSFNDLNTELVLRKVHEQARAWSEPFRPILRNEVLGDSSRFILIDPRQVNAEIYPLVFWCSNKRCKKIFDLTNQNRVPVSSTCPRCNEGKLAQLRFIKVHRCGHMEPLTPPACKNNHGTSNMALDDRGSERIGEFRWKCQSCNDQQNLFGGRCSKCVWPDPSQQVMNIEVFRANKTYYVHSATLINIPISEFNDFFSNKDWHVIVAAKYLDLPELHGVKVSDFAKNLRNQGTSNISSSDLGTLLSKLRSNEITQEEFLEKADEMRNKKSNSIEDLEKEISSRTHMPTSFWEDAKYEILDTLIPKELGRFSTLDALSAEYAKATSLGIKSVSLISDFPIVTASYGFSRVEYSPNSCYLNPFPIDRDYGGKYPIYIDKVSADAIQFTLSYTRVLRWLRENDINIEDPRIENDENIAKAYILSIFNGVNIYEKLFDNQPEARMILGLLHTFSHLLIKQASLISGLEKTSIAEYITPKTLSFSIYCNHRFGATIGALTSLFEQSLLDWFNQIELEKKCVYDPVCYENEANCHSCTHLAETSCRLFNLNLSRKYLFGGEDDEFGGRIKGYFEIKQTY